MKFIVSCARGLSSVLKNELVTLGITSAESKYGSVIFDGNIEDAYHVIIWSRVASRVAILLAAEPVETAEDLYRIASSVSWQDHMSLNDTFSIDVIGTTKELRNTQFSALRIKDALADQFTTNFDARPNVDKDNPSIKIAGKLNKDMLLLGVELTKEAMHQRDYRPQHTGAPLRETLAAALLLLADWPKHAGEGQPFHDPMCGSGTIVIEAAMIAANIAPATLWISNDINGWAQHDRALWKTKLTDALSKQTTPKNQIIGSDLSPRAIQISKENAQRAGLSEHITLKQMTVQDAHPCASEGVMVFNPPYGDRLEDEDKLAILYADFGDHLRTQFGGWKVGLITHHQVLTRRIPLAPDTKHQVMNGKLKCHFYLYNIFAKTEDSKPVEVSQTARWGKHGEMLANRLKKNIRTIGKQAKREGIQCYRLYDADLPDYNFALDKYGDEYVLQEYAAPKEINPEKALQRIHDAVVVICDLLSLNPKQVHLKVRRPQTRFDKYKKTDSSEQQFIGVREAEASFKVNLTDYVDTGLFLDHRPVRLEIAKLAKDRSFLNLFCYTATATVHAALGGATHSTSVDLSNTYINWAEKNFRANDLDIYKHKLVKADCFSWLRGNKKEFDLIFLDPPTFSNSKKFEGELDIQRDHVALIELALRSLSEDGLLIFSTNLRKFTLDRESLSDWDIEDRTAWSIPFDFKRNSKIHQCYFISRY